MRIAAERQDTGDGTGISCHNNGSHAGYVG